MSANTPLAPVPDLDTIVSDVEHLARQAHEFISRGKPPPGAIASEWVPLYRQLKRRLEQLGRAIDEVPAELWDIVQAGPEGAGHGLHLFPVRWQTHEAARHTEVMQRLVEIRSTIAGLPKTPPTTVYPAYRVLREYAAKELKGDGRKAVEVLCSSNGSLPLVDFALAMGWDCNNGRIDDGQWSSLQQRLKPKLRKQGWELRRHDNHAQLRPYETATKK